MNSERRAILSLIAMGRITPREAERLLAVSSGSDETVLRIAVVLAVAWMVVPYAHDFVSGLWHAIGLIAMWASTTGRHAVALAVDLVGVGGRL